MDYNIKNITDLTEISAAQIRETDYFLIGRNSNSYYSTFKTAFEELSSLVLANVRSAMSSVYDDLSCLNGKSDVQLHGHVADAYVTKQLLNEINSKTYPVGSLYFTTKSNDPSEILNWPSSKWEKISQGRCIMGADQDNSNLSTVIDSSLPIYNGYVKITGLSATRGGVHSHQYRICSKGGSAAGHAHSGNSSSGTDTYASTLVDSGHTHTIYGNNAKFTMTGDGIYSNEQKTVQPPAFFVNIWERKS